VLNASIAENPLLVQIMIELRHRYAKLNLHYESAFTDSFCTRRCRHAHQTLIEAAGCASLSGAGWYVVAVEYDTPLELTQAENVFVNEFAQTRPRMTNCDVNRGNHSKQST
jgi:hypothetical protein